MNLTRNQWLSTAVSALLAAVALPVVSWASADEKPKGDANDFKVPAALADMYALEKAKVKSAPLFSSKAVLWGTNEQGKVVVGVIVKNESSRPIWLPRHFETINVQIDKGNEAELSHLDGFGCHFPKDYIKVDIGGYHVYEVDLRHTRLVPFAHKLDLWAPVRKSLADNAGEVIIERVSAVLAPETLLTILKKNTDTDEREQ